MSESDADAPVVLTKADLAALQGKLAGLERCIYALGSIIASVADASGIKLQFVDTADLPANLKGN